MDDGLPKYEFEGDRGPQDLFQHSVASGDPLPDSVILWTRVTGASGASGASVQVFYEVALDDSFGERVAAAYVDATAERDWTAKIDVRGLEPGTTYYYRFFSLGRESPIGRTRTAVAGSVEGLRFAVASCASLAHGYFHAYARIAQRADLDFVLHVGDYIYEFESGGYGSLRNYEPPNELVSLDDYRKRYAQYRREAALQDCHRQHPMINVWDDHEIAGNSWRDGAEKHQREEGSYQARKDAAYRAFSEWLPYREGKAGIIYRSLAFGDLLELVLLDTRIAGRDQQVELAQVEDDPSREMLGTKQVEWLEGVLKSTTANWKVIANQVVLAPMRLGEGPLNADQWDGYPGARRRFLDILAKQSPTNTVVVTGDFHSSWVFEVADDPYNGSYDPVCVEFVGPAVTAAGFPSDLAATFMAANPHMKWGQLTERGYMLVDVTPGRVQTSYWHVDNIEDANAGSEQGVSTWRVNSGKNKVVQDADPVAEAPNPPPLAP